MSTWGGGKTVTPIDYNADGLSDFLEIYGSGGRAYAKIYVNTGSGYSAGIRSTLGGWGAGRKFYPVDTNRDGRTEIVEIYNVGGNAYATTWIERNGYYQMSHYNMYLGTWNARTFQFLDSNADGFVEIAAISNDGSNNYSIRLSSMVGATKEQITSIENGLGVKTDIAYTLSSHSPNVIDSNTLNCGGGTGIGHGQACGIALKANSSLVTNVSTNYKEETRSKSYSYSNARFYPGSVTTRSSLGFQSITTSDDQRAGYYSVKEFYQIKPFQGMPRRERTYINHALAKEIEYSLPTQYECYDSGCTLNADIHSSFPRQMRPGKVKSIAYDGVSTIITEQEALDYDSYGSALLASKKVSGNGQSKTYFAKSEYINQITLPRAFGLAYTKKEYINTELDANTVAESRTYYDRLALGAVGTKLNPTKSEKWIGGPRSSSSSWASTSKTFNAEGMAATETDPKGITTTLTYENDHRLYVVQSVSSAGSISYSKQAEYDARFGILTWERQGDGSSQSGLQNFIELDVFGREIESLSKDRNNNLLAKASSSYYLSSTIHYVEKCAYYDSGFTQSTCSREYKDSLGRTVRKVVPGIDGETQKYLVTAYEYDSLGRLYRVSEPYFSNVISGDDTSPSLWASRTFDSRDRLATLTRPDGNVISTSYNQTTLIASAISVHDVIDENGITKRTFQNEDGNPIRIMQAVGTSDAKTIDYTYYNHGGLRQVIAPQGITTIEYYEGSLWQKSIDEPNAGKTDYTYYSVPGVATFGELHVETRPDPNASSGTITVTHEYNHPFGRLTKQTYSGGGLTDSVASFKYDATALTSDASQNYYAKGRLTESSYTAAGYTYHRNYGYDVFGATTTTETLISHNAKTLCADATKLPCRAITKQTFDELGRKTSVTYPDDKVTNFNYHGTSSAIHTIEHDSITYATYTGYNTRSQIGRVAYQNGVHTDYTYKANSGLLNTAITKNSSNQLLKDHSYSFDGVGNITQIDNGLISGYKYNFTYDKLNRLSQATRADGRTFSYSFDSKGNITNRDSDNLEYYSGTTKLAKRTYFDQKSSKSVVENYSWSAAGNMLTRGTLSTYQYDRQNMLRKVTKDDGSIAENFYDESGQRFLKTFQQTGELPIKTFFLGTGYELKEKWQHGQRRGYQATKTIFGLDNQRLATLTDTPTALPIAALEKPQDYIAIAGILTFTNYTEAFTKIKLLIKGLSAECHSLVDDVTPYLPLIAILILILLYFTNTLPFTVNRDSKASVALAMCALLLFMHCRGDGSPTVYHNYDFSSIYDGLPSGVYFYVNDHIGSSSLAIDENENEVIRLHYTPYGKIDEAASGVYNQTTNKLENTIAQPNHLITATKFALHNFDPENELYYMNARYYDPLIGSFTTADTYVDGEDTFMGFNRYAYVHGNPIKYNDPTGHAFDPFSFVVGVVIVVINGCLSDRGCRSAVEDEVNSWFGNETNNVEENGGSSDNTLYLGGSSNYDNGNYGVYTGFNDYGNINWLDRPQPEDHYDGYNTGNDGGFYGEPNSEGFPKDGNSFGPTTPSAYIDPVQEMVYQDYRRYQNNREFDGIQRTLDAAGLVPIFGIGADLVNAGISAARGNWKDAAMSLGAAVPVVGMAAGLYRLGKAGLKGAKGAYEAYGSAREAFRAAKRANNIPLSKQPEEVLKIRDKFGRGYLRQYNFINSHGKRISIRRDLPLLFKDGGRQGAHFNSGFTGGKLKGHFYFK